MVKINEGFELQVKAHGKLMTEISAVYNNRFIKKTYLGMSYKQAIKKFEEDIKKGN